ncbi:MAG: C25 family cysteine peptidase [Pirellulaceae bacterium]
MIPSRPVVLIGFLFVLLAGRVGWCQGVLAPVTDKADTLVVCSAEFKNALARWLEYREGQGHRFVICEPPDNAYELATLIKKIAAENKLQTIVFVGDAGHDVNEIVTDFRPAKVNVLFGSDPEIATDNPFADLDSDGIPDVALGRIPANTPEELLEYTERVIKYENDRSSNEWKRRINVVAGVGGFDPVTDKMIEQTTALMVNQHLPNGYPFSMTYGSWSSPYCPAPERFGETALEKFNEGCLFWVYAGHGSRHRLDSVFTPKGRYEILDNKSISKLAAREGNPIALMLCCYCGAFDDPQDCLAENMLSQERGPIAVLCGTRVTMPYAMSQLSLELMNEYFNGDAETIGELFLRSKRRLVEPDEMQKTFEFRKNIEELGRTLSPRPDLLSDELTEHLLLYHLLGDPLVRLQRAAELELQAEIDSLNPQIVHVTGSSNWAGELILETCYERGRFRSRPLYRDENKLQANGNADFHDDYLKNQNRVCTAEMHQINTGPFSMDVELPADASGAITVRAFLQNESGYAVGSCDLKVVRNRR